MGIRKSGLLLLALALLLAGCRFAVVETDEVRIETPTATPPATVAAPAEAIAPGVETKN